MTFSNLKCIKLPSQLSYRPSQCLIKPQSYRNSSPRLPNNNISIFITRSNPISTRIQPNRCSFKVMFLKIILVIFFEVGNMNILWATNSPEPFLSGNGQGGLLTPFSTRCRQEIIHFLKSNFYRKYP